MKNKRLLCIVLLGLVLIVTIPTYVRYSAKKEWQAKIYESIKNSNYHSLKELLSQGT